MKFYHLFSLLFAVVALPLSYSDAKGRFFIKFRHLLELVPRFLHLQGPNGLHHFSPSLLLDVICDYDPFLQEKTRNPN